MMKTPLIRMVSRDTLKGPSISSHTAVRLKQAEREEIEAQTREFLARGKQIKKLDNAGVAGE